jgi:hypothetical protein
MDTTLYESYRVSLGVNTPEKLSKLLQFCEENGIYMEPLPENPLKLIQLSREKKYPKKSFASFCGPEHLNRQGQTSEQGIYDTIMMYAEALKLIKPDGSIRLNDALQTSLGTEKNQLYPHEVAVLIPTLLV